MFALSVVVRSIVEGVVGTFVDPDGHVALVTTRRAAFTEFTSKPKLSVLVGDHSRDRECRPALANGCPLGLQPKQVAENVVKVTVPLVGVVGVTLISLK